MITMQEQDFWRQTINGLGGPALPVKGKKAPPSETMKKKPENKDRKVLAQKIFSTIYVFTDIEGKTFVVKSDQKLHVLGEMTLEEGLELAQKDSS